MKRIQIWLDDELYDFYRKIGERAGGLEAEQVMADALFKLAGGLSISAIEGKKEKSTRNGQADAEGKT